MSAVSNGNGGTVYSDAHRGMLARIAEPLARRARRGRHDLYRQVMAPGPEERIVDVGCGSEGLAGFEHDADITGLDAEERPGYPGRRFVRGDARALPFADGEFGIAYSNSLVEHLDPGDRERFADEIRRVADRYWVQTPNRYFPVEPHVLLPGFQFLPEGARRRLWRLGMPRTPYEPIELLGAAELRELFPDAVILRERFAGLTKSLIAAGPAGRVQTPG
ncbi:MAG: class I SAM-dependent methyltransferase [Solirubrobacterales bacterium]